MHKRGILSGNVSMGCLTPGPSPLAERGGDSRGEAKQKPPLIRRRFSFVYEGKNYLLRPNISLSMSSVVVMTLELAWKPLSVTIMSVKVSERSTFDISRAPA